MSFYELFGMWLLCISAFGVRSFFIDDCRLDFVWFFIYTLMFLWFIPDSWLFYYLWFSSFYDLTHDWISMLDSISFRVYFMHVCFCSWILIAFWFGLSVLYRLFMNISVALFAPSEEWWLYLCGDTLVVLCEDGISYPISPGNAFMNEFAVSGSVNFISRFTLCFLG